jgi:hypothetical protein
MPNKPNPTGEPPPEVALAEAMVRVLQTQRRLGPAFYPVRLSRVIELTGLAPRKAVLSKARKYPPFTVGVTALVKHPDPPLSLSDDAAQAVGNAALLEFLLETGRSDEVQAFSVADLTARVMVGLRELFAAAITQQMDGGTLPPGIACVATKKDRLLFRLQDARGGGPALPAQKPDRDVALPETTVPPPADFAAAFDAAFAQLDREAGSTNFVNLTALRHALPFSRSAFDAGFRRLREAGRYTLSAAEDGHGIDEKQRSAAIHEEGTLLVFVSRR